jgi:Spy/CpxP family protein refolding chaperone
MNFNLLIMKNIILYTFLIILFVGQHTIAQNNMRAKREQVKAQKAAFITNKLDLDANSSQKFWPIYNEYQLKKEVISNRKREVMQKLTIDNNLSETEFEKLGDEFIELNVKESTLAQEYHFKFKDALSPSQILKLYKAENQFKQYLIKQIREHQGNQPRRRN